jgi:hypothetical protein
MAELWMPGAIRSDVGDHAPCDPAYPAKAIAHITWDRNATAKAPVDLVSFSALKSYFTNSGSGVAPHVLWSPFTGEFAQFFPADSRSKSVVDLAGGTRTNRAGKVVLQIEALFFPYCLVDGKTYPTLASTPCKGWDTLNTWIRSWGVPDVWPMGRPVDFSPHRSETVWETEGGWYGHSQVPENTHVDPGSWPEFVPPATPVVQPLPTVDLSRLVSAAHTDPHAAQGHQTYPAGVRLVEKALDKLGYLNVAYALDGSYGTATVAAYAKWQRHLGYSGSAADGIPGRTSLTKLGVKSGLFTVVS